ncbi:MAG TPA: helix-turn-helix transcriptional regulator, partial [Polyangiaceae bacterium]
EAECRRARRAVERLLTPHPSRAESEIIEVMATLIEQFESRERPTPHVSTRQLLEHLMDSRSISRAELARATGIPRSTVTNLLAGKRAPSKANIQALANYFGVSALAFFPESTTNARTPHPIR